MDKAQIRRDLAGRRAALPAADARARSDAACANLRALPEWTGAASVALYAAAHGEIDPSPVVAELLSAGRRVCYPRIVGDALELYSIDRHDALVPGARGIPAPPAAALPCAPDAVDVWVVPGVAFDERGGRIGRGGGHYDRALAGARGFKVGLAYELQVLPEVPVEPHDVRVDAVVTEARVIRSGTRSRG